jgi:hypothetical protein
MTKIIVPIAAAVLGIVLRVTQAATVQFPRPNSQIANKFH